jgi:hypothetical protein
MAYPPTQTPEAPPSEGLLLKRLLGLYAEERRLYSRVLELSQRQGDLVRQGSSLGEVRRLLEQKKGCLNIIARLERLEQGSKREWERRRGTFSGDGRARLRTALDEVAGLIEQILACEEQNDRELIEQSQAV